MARTEVPVPDKVTITLREPDRSVLAFKPSRTLIDLLYIAGPIPASGIRSAERQVHSLVYLAQEFGIMDTDYEFSIGFSKDLFSTNLSWNLNVTTLRDMSVSNEAGVSFRLTPKAIELLEAVGGPQTIDDEDKVKRLAELARNETLIPLANFIFTRKQLERDVKDEKLSQKQADGLLSTLTRFSVEDLEKLEQEVRSS